MRSRKERNKKIALMIFLCLLLTGLVTTLTLSGYLYSKFDKITSVSISKAPKQLGISSAAESKVDSLDNPPLNIALFGLDKEPHNKHINSDAIIIVSINRSSKVIKLASILRDTYVKIDGKGMDKINSAYNTGGPQLALKTLNQNFNLNIKDFVSVDIQGMANVIDAIGGITLNVKKEEIYWMNFYLDEANTNRKVSVQHITKPGIQLLDGKQAVAYTRIRYTAGNDYERTERQRSVLSLLLSKIKERSPIEYPLLISHILPYIETSFDQKDLLKISAEVVIQRITNIQKKRFPLDAVSKGKIINNIWYYVTDLKQTADSLQHFIYSQ